MSTRSFIGIKENNGTIKAIYCHHDGYVSYVGAILNRYYVDSEKVEQLMELGDLSVLGVNPTDGGWSCPKNFITNDEGFCSECLAYRSRPEDDVDFREYKDEAEFLERVKATWAEYAYLFTDGEGLVNDLCDGSEFTSLTAELYRPE